MRNLDEWAATRLLAQAGLSVPKSALVSSVDEALRAAREIHYPVVMKCVLADIVHKTEAGGVALNLGSEQEVRDAAQRLFTLSDRIMVAEMVTDAVAEIIVGVSRDALFGLYLMIGLGGVTVELIADRKILLLPASDSDIRDALLSLKLAPLLQGYRGRPLADIEAVVASVSAIAGFVEQNSDSIVELEINPLLVRRQDGGAYVADALLNIVGELPGEK